MEKGKFITYYLNDDVDGIRELEEWLKENLEKDIHYKLYVGYGDDYANAVDILKSVLQEDILELLDGVEMLNSEDQ